MSKSKSKQESKRATTTPLASADFAQRPWSERLTQTWVLALAGAMFYWLSLPPMRLPFAGYLAAACWVAIVAKECELSRNDYWRIWFAGCLMWLALLQGVRLAFWPLYAGWIALSLYLAVYLPLFIGMARSLHRKWMVPLPIATAVAWVGCELIRAYFVTGFAACMLAHSQVPWPWMLPIASVFGSYGVSFLVMFIGAVVYQWIAWANQVRKPSTDGEQPSKLQWNIAWTVLCVVAIALSFWSLQSRDAWIAKQGAIKPLGSILLIQEDMPTQFDGPAESAVIGWNRYDRQTKLAASTYSSKSIDLVVWPESTFIAGPNENFLFKPFPDWIETEEVAGEFGLSDKEFPEYLRICRNATKIKADQIASHFAPSRPVLLLGADVLKVRAKTKVRRYNAALWIDSKKDDSIEYYAKQHLVLFGETFPLITDLLNAIGFGVAGIDAGENPMAFKLPSGVVVSASICFEDVLPHKIQSHVRELSSGGLSPDILVNVTNDGWFRGSSILDHHLNNAILAAVENRRPMLVAANLGISAWIDGDGRVVRSLPRLEAGSILAEPIADGRWGLWQSIGDWPARFLALISCLAFFSWFAKKK